jgi:basic membrane protein A
MVIAFALVAAACSSSDDATDTTQAATGEVLKVAFVHVGPVADKGWSWAHDQGAQALKAAMGDGVEITTLESIPEGSDAQRVFEDLAADGNTLIFGTSFGYMDPMLAAGENFPDTVFMHATGFKTSENMGNYFGAAEEARYLSGMAAGAATETNLIGYVAAFPIPEVLRGINAFTLGAREVNPDAQVQVVWTSTWFDPPKEGTAAESLLDAGADVIAMHQDSAAPGQAAEAAGAGWVGYNTDMTEFAPTAWLTAAIWDWAPFYIETAQQVVDGSWQSVAVYGNMADGMVALAPFGDAVEQATRDLILVREGEIKDGSFAVFSDPIVNQDGESQPLGDIFGMDFFVEGVIGSPTG